MRQGTRACMHASYLYGGLFRTVYVTHDVTQRFVPFHVNPQHNGIARAGRRADSQTLLPGKLVHIEHAH